MVAKLGRAWAAAGLAAAWLAGCSDPQNPAPGPAPKPPAGPAATATALAPAATAPVAPALPAAGQAINAAAFGATPPADGRADPVLVRAQVLLDRARFSPGVIDGRDGENLRQVLAAFERAHDLPADGRLDAMAWAALTEADTGPAMQAYVVTAEDVAGPFLGQVPDDMKALAELDRVGYASPAEALAERFHMDQDLLEALNPGVDFGKAGAVVLVTAPRQGALPEVARLEVDKGERAVKAYGADGTLLAFYPASVGSAERPAPSGTWAVRAVAPDPVYYYDPDRLTFGKAEAKGALKIAAGPNNPVGSTWIDLTKDTYGIHGTPDPEVIGKRQSHGCVRLTNWDAAELGKAVKAGVEVAFVG